MQIETPETEKGKILRELAEATDFAEAFRDWSAALSASGRSFLYSISSDGVQSETDCVFMQMMSDALPEDINQRLKADVQSSLDAKVEELYARYRVLMDGDVLMGALAAPETSNVVVMPTKRRATSKTAPKKARAK